MIKNVRASRPSFCWAASLLQATVAQMRGRETPNQQVGYSNPVYLKSFFLIEFMLHNIGTLIENVTAILMTNVCKISRVREADMRS